MKKVKSTSNKNIDLIFFKYTFLLYILFLSLLLRSKVFVIVSFLIYISFLLTTSIRVGGITKIPMFIMGEGKIIIHNLVKNLRKINKRRFNKFINDYKIEGVIIVIYVIIMTSVVSWGLPSESHPFPYFMDESHSLQAVKTVVKYGSSNLPHQEVGPMFNYIVSAILVSPLFVFKIINPSEITTAISALVVQAQLYTALRIITFLFGVATLIVLIRISKILKVKSWLVLSLFVFTPVFLLISNYFKYDVALLFWISLSLFFNLFYAEQPKLRNYILISFVSGLAISTKLTGAPLFVLLIFSFFYSTPVWKKKISYLVVGCIVFVLTFILCGVPDVVFGGKSMTEYLYYNTISQPQNDKNILFGVSHLYYLFLQLLPEIYGHAFFALSFLSILYLVVKIIHKFFLQKLKQEKNTIILLVGLSLFVVSLSPLWIIAANRALVLLPFLALLTSLAVEDLFKFTKKEFPVLPILLVGLVIGLQVYETYAWLSLKYSPSSQETSSAWVKQNIKSGSVIGVENIPIYQMLPDIVIKEFYENVYLVKKSHLFKYELIDAKTKKLPSVIILSNAQFDKKYRKSSPKKDLLGRMEKESYKEVISFYPNSSLYKTFVNDIDFVTIGLIAYPLRISVFERQ